MSRPQVPPDSIVGRADAFAPPFACSWTDAGLNAVLVHLAGELDVDGTPQLEQTLRDPASQPQLIVVDMRDLEFMDSSGVHAIVDASARVRQLGRRLVVLRGPPEVDRLFTLTGKADYVETGDADRSPVRAPARRTVPRERRRPCARRRRDRADRARELRPHRADAGLRPAARRPRRRGLARVGRDPALARPARPRHHLHPDRAGHHRRLPPALHPSQLQDRPHAASAAGGARLDGGRGPGDRMGGHPPQAPSLLGPARRPAQPPRRPGAGMARDPARARPRARRLDVPRPGHGQPRRATPRTCWPTATCASSAARSPCGSPSASPSRSAWAFVLTGSIAGGLTGCCGAGWCGCWSCIT